jgi:hypothetical protein
MLASERTSRTTSADHRSTTALFAPIAGISAILAGVAGFLYAIAFLVVARSQPELGAALSALLLLLLGLLATASLTALYERLRETDPATALWGLLLGIAGALGAAVHGGYDLANAIHPPAAASALADLPSPVDPRGLLTFGVAGLGLLVVSRLILRDDRFPRGLGYLGIASAILLIVLYLGRLIVLAPTSPIILAPAVANGFVLNPLWYVWLGVVFVRGR